MSYDPVPVNFAFGYTAGTAPMAVAFQTGSLTSGVFSVWLYHDWELDFHINDDTGGLSINFDSTSRHFVASFWTRSVDTGDIVDLFTLSDYLLTLDPAVTCAAHILFAFDLSDLSHAVYVNDVEFTSATLSSLTGVGGAVPSFTDANVMNGDHPGVSLSGYAADLWLGSTASWVDLSVAANRRKFINADLSAVDLGATGAAPFGAPPEFFQSVRAEGEAYDWLTNRGSVGGALQLFNGDLLLSGNPCALAPPASAFVAYSAIFSVPPGKTR